MKKLLLFFAITLASHQVWGGVIDLVCQANLEVKDTKGNIEKQSGVLAIWILTTVDNSKVDLIQTSGFVIGPSITASKDKYTYEVIDKSTDDIWWFINKTIPESTSIAHDVTEVRINRLSGTVTAHIQTDFKDKNVLFTTISGQCEKVDKTKKKF